ncbi:MAG: hypothetical protein WBH51_16150 [Mycolicibacter algericus]|uniref:hypothetical protein n=1 Tax=Mycolicibacter algericus TaxID=1288388 RepID=UPI003C768582
MPDEEQPDISTAADGDVVEPGETTVETPRDDQKPATKKGVPPAAKAPKGGISGYGLASAFLGLVAIGALVFGLITWSMHRDDVDERAYRSRVLQTAASWTSVLINLNAENVEKGMTRLRDKTVGELNSEFDAALEPYREVVQKIQSRSSGRIEAVAIELERHNLDDPAAGNDQPPSPGRTDPVMVIATSIAENVGGRPQTVHWALHLDVTDVDGHLMISRLRSIR